MENSKPVLSVTEISLSLKACVEQVFADIRVRGEVSGVKKAASGHIYFSLKDSDSVLSAVAWRGRDKITQSAIEEGLEIICTGKLSTYPGRSNYQMIVEYAEPAGVGALLKLLNDRKEKLAKEGLFDIKRKKKIPYLPEVIGIVTSPTGAVIRDIMHRLNDRFPRQVVLWPVLVQGDTAAEQVAGAIRGFNAMPAEGIYLKSKTLTSPDAASYIQENSQTMPFLVDSDCQTLDFASTASLQKQGAKKNQNALTSLSQKEGFIHIPRPDVLIVARGGGSLEDLWTFNEEVVVRATSESNIPLISAVGHETDTTLIDFASDLRAPTPTAAAEYAVPVKFELITKISSLQTRLNESTFRYLSEKKLKIENLSKSMPNLSDVINLFIQKLDDRSERLQISLKNYIKNKENQFVNIKNLLKSYSFQAVLERGFSLTTDIGGKIIASATLAKTLPQLVVSFFDGKVDVVPIPKGSASNMSSVNLVSTVLSTSRCSTSSVVTPSAPSSKTKPRRTKKTGTNLNQKGFFDDI